MLAPRVGRGGRSRHKRKLSMMPNAYLSMVGLAMMLYVHVTMHCLAAVLAIATVLLRMLRGLLLRGGEEALGRVSKEDEMWLLESTTRNPMYVAAREPRSSPFFCQPHPAGCLAGCIGTRSCSYTSVEPARTTCRRSRRTQPHVSFGRAPRCEYGPRTGLAAFLSQDAHCRHVGWRDIASSAVGSRPTTAGCAAKLSQASMCGRCSCLAAGPAFRRS